MTTSMPRIEEKPTPMNQGAKEHSVIAIYESHEEAEQAVKTLERAGLDMKRLSIVGKDFRVEEHPIGFYSSDDKMKFWGGQGAFWGGLWGMLFGSAFFFIPGVGPLVVMGPMVAWIVGALEGAVLGGGAGILAAALSSIGIPEDQVMKYELEVKAGKFLVLARGSEELVERARIALGTTGASQLTRHAAA